MKIKLFSALVVVFGLLLIGASAGLAAGGCKQSVRVNIDDSLNAITQRHNVELGEFVKANRIYKDAPGSQRRTIFVGQVFCLDGLSAWNGKAPTWASWPAADFRGYLVGKELVIRGWNFNYPTGYYVKVSSLPKMLLKVKYRLFQKTFVLGKGFEKTSSLVFCLKNNVTDSYVCRTAYRLRK